MGHKLKSILVNEGITQAELSRESGVGLGTINRVCNNRRTIAPTTRSKLLKALNTLADDVYELADIFSNGRNG